MIAICTAFKDAFVALDIKDKQDFITLDADAKQSENLLFKLDELLANNNLSITDNNDYAVIVGPGSFTGLRIGLALVKGLCAGQNIQKVYPISSLDFLAYSYAKQNNPKANFVCVLNALSGLYFVCEYNEAGEKLGEEKLLSQEELAKIKLPKVGLLSENLQEVDVFEQLSPQLLLDLANKLKKAGKQENVNSLSPVYLRKSQAEVNLEQKSKK